MKEIFLTQGYIAIVDDEDFERVNKIKWHVEKTKARTYAIHTIHGKNINGKQGYDKPLRMHRLILNAPQNKDVDHIDLNGLNNQKINLRLCNNSENLRNRNKPRNNTSGYKGVCWYKTTKKWHAQINVSGKVMSIGYFLDKIEAAKAYDEAAIKYFGKFARPNF